MLQTQTHKTTGYISKVNIYKRKRLFSTKLKIKIKQKKKVKDKKPTK